MTNKKLITDITTLDAHSTLIMTTYGCAMRFLVRRRARRAWWMMVTAVKAAHADENPNKNVTSVRESHDGSSGSYQDGIRKPPMLLGVESWSRTNTNKMAECRTWPARGTTLNSKRWVGEGVYDKFAT